MLRRASAKQASHQVADMLPSSPLVRERPHPARHQVSRPLSTLIPPEEPVRVYSGEPFTELKTIGCPYHKTDMAMTEQPRCGLPVTGPICGCRLSCPWHQPWDGLGQLPRFVTARLPPTLPRHKSLCTPNNSFSGHHTDDDSNNCDPVESWVLLVALCPSSSSR